MTSGYGRSISVPLQELDKCSVCSKTEKLRVCSSCAQVIYCSKECQKKAWAQHKTVCSQTHRINLKIFHPMIAYMFEYFRTIIPPNQPLHRQHPAFLHQIMKSPLPGYRRVTDSAIRLHYTITLGRNHVLGERGNELLTWWRGKTNEDKMKLFHHVMRETFVPEVTVVVSLILLSEVYSSYYVRTPQVPGEPPVFFPWEKRPLYRLEHGQSPVVDFGICRGKIESKKNRVQTWTYHDPKTGARNMVLDPDRHLWLYFRTIQGEEVFLDCSSYSFGMEACMDATKYLLKVSKRFRVSGAARIPAYFFTTEEQDRLPYVLKEEKRFSVMHNKDLWNALSWQPDKPKKEKAIVRDFLASIQEKECTAEQEERLDYYRMYGSLMMNQVLSGRHWKDWEKPEMYRRNDLWDTRDGWDEWQKAGPTDANYKAELTGLTRLFVDACGGE
ncbi:hypothetical protein P691DRAFT_680837 [Macrolepiota fuliginosa MF-IS2]|uniref:MYND-type domain-containing protein n=1 Tax=Macrolepiota fuliginosa MF-IS2 TaxID=1400762 RepID=A0A9P5X3W6_9AGAR|nr:hypothetical protein P691DRAFT_680837 [Macrolepiota fuliginosa MF-IS2]